MASRSSKSKVRQFPTHIDIPVEKRSALIEMLNQNLADTLDLYTQVKQAHWNVKGTDFYQLHLLFDEIAEEIEPFIDLLAERVTLLGGYANGTARMSAEKLDPSPNIRPTPSRDVSTSRPSSSGSRSTAPKIREATPDDSRRDRRPRDRRPLQRHRPGRRQAPLVPRGPHPDRSSEPRSSEPREAGRVIAR